MQKNLVSARFLLPALPLAATVWCAMSCASPSVAEDDTSLENADSELGTVGEPFGSCKNPRSYAAIFEYGSGSCAPIRGARGAWLPEPVFVGAPQEVQAFSCRYRWSGTDGARPDRARLHEAVGFSGKLAPVCGPEMGVRSAAQGVSVRVVSSFTGPEVAENPLGIGPQGGAVGCDVCGLLINRDLYVVYPIDRGWRQDFVVGLSDGGFRTFQLDPGVTQAPAVAGGAVALSVELPPPPVGTTYIQGNVEIR